MNDEVEMGVDPSERARDAGGDGATLRRRRMSAQLEQGAVLRLLRGEALELVSRELEVTAAELSGWRDDFLCAGEASLKARPADGRDLENARLKAKVGELTMATELLEAKIERLPTPRSKLRGDPEARAGALWPRGGRDPHPEAAGCLGDPGR